MLFLTKKTLVSRVNAAWLLRQTISAVLLLTIALTTRALIAGIRVSHSPTVSPVGSDRYMPPLTDGVTHAANVAAAHLFGAPAVATQAVPLAAGSDLSLAGIMYSQSAEESRAIVVSGGDTIVAAQGTRLTNGAVISAIAQDRILVNEGRYTFSVMLDMKKANYDERVPVLAVAGSGPGGMPPSSAPMGMEPDAAADGQIVQAQPPVAHMVIHGQYLPLSSIRGKDARSHFNQMGVPTGTVINRTDGPAGRSPNP